MIRNFVVLLICVLFSARALAGESDAKQLIQSIKDSQSAVQDAYSKISECFKQANDGAVDNDQFKRDLARFNERVG